MADKKCPRCGLWNSSVALRCDCGYDFNTGLVEVSYSQQQLPSSIKTYFKIYIFQLALAVVLSLFAGFSSRNILLTVISLFLAVGGALFYIFLYSQFLKKENWARMALAILFFPLGLYLLFSEEVKMFMMQLDE